LRVIKRKKSARILKGIPEKPCILGLRNPKIWGLQIAQTIPYSLFPIPY
jgi:hypothetical protein